MTPTGLLILYCAAIVIASLIGGWVPLLVRLTHRRLELAVSFVSGVMLGIAVLHLLPHAVLERAAAGHRAIDHGLLEPVLLWLLAGFTAMFVIQRFARFHHHDAPEDEPGCDDDHGHDHDHDHHNGAGDRAHLEWTGAFVGLTLHSAIAGIALAAAIVAESPGAAAGFGTFLVILLHKPFDSLTIGTLMAKRGSSRRARHVANALFGLVVPAGAMLFLGGASLAGEGGGHGLVSAALAFSAGTFLCIALSDLLPELHFHRHDRVKLTAALLLGLAVAAGAARLEAAMHAGHDHGDVGIDEAHAHDHDHP